MSISPVSSTNSTDLGNHTSLQWQYRVILEKTGDVIMSYVSSLLEFLIRRCWKVLCLLINSCVATDSVDLCLCKRKLQRFPEFHLMNIQGPALEHYGNHIISEINSTLYMYLDLYLIPPGVQWFQEDVIYRHASCWWDRVTTPKCKELQAVMTVHVCSLAQGPLIGASPIAFHPWNKLGILACAQSG